MSANKYQKNSYNPWPLGQIKDEWVRPEIAWAKKNGYFTNDPREIVSEFESQIAKYAGSRYAVSVDCCSHGLFLALKYKLNTGEISPTSKIGIPANTYASVPMQILHAGLKPIFNEYAWNGIYQLEGTNIYDSAGRFTKGMYTNTDSIQILSFQIKKTLPIGRGGMILLDDENQYRWLLRARHDGRDLTTPYNDSEHITQLGWHFYMTPEDAARGLFLFEQLPEDNPDCMSSVNYPDLRNWPIWGK